MNFVLLIGEHNDILNDFLYWQISNETANIISMGVACNNTTTSTTILLSGKSLNFGSNLYFDFFQKYTLEELQFELLFFSILLFCEV